MIEKLLTILNDKSLILGLLSNPEIWNTLDVDYFPPRVERIYTNIGENRLYLHLIHKTDLPCLFHKHSWPSAIIMLDGSYEMGIAYSSDNISSDDAYKLPIAAKMYMNEGSGYEMTDPNGLHYVKPITEYSLSVMLSGPKYKNIEPEIGSTFTFENLSSDRKEYLLKIFYTKIRLYKQSYFIQNLKL